MATAGMSGGMVGGIGDVTIVGTAGVAALDTPQLTATKLEIRTLVAEIAELSTADVDCETFLQGMLPRVCAAMGATAAAVWELDSSATISLRSSHKLPTAIYQSDAAQTEAHQRILQCVASEGQPILVPPQSIHVAANRPTNPLDEALLIVPIRIHDRVDTLLEVIQPGSGGPAAQRGYLRFVAQMADLLADFLRRWRLRTLNANAAYVQRLQEYLLAVSGEQSPRGRAHLIAQALARLIEADMVFLLRRGKRRWHVLAVSELSSFDPRSEIVLAAEKVLLQHYLQPIADHGASYELLSDRRTTSSDPSAASALATTSLEAAAQRSPEASTADGEAVPQPQSPADSLCIMLGCSYLFRLPLAGTGDDQLDNHQVLVAAHAEYDRSLLEEHATELAHAFGGLLSGSTNRGSWFGWASVTNSQLQTPTSRKQNQRLHRIERWIVRSSTVLLVAAVAFFPTPDQLGAIAVLEAVDKEQYYAPVSASVDKVLVDSDQQVGQGEPLIELVDRQLEARVDELSAQRLTCATQLEQDRAALLRGQQLTPGQRDELESRIEQHKISLRSLDDQLAILRTQSAQLQIKARHAALVTTWDARNRLQGRPVAAGQLLLTTCAPDADWQLRLSIPEREAGRINHALSGSPAGLPVQFSLSSHPSEVRTGRLVGLSKQLLKGEDGVSKFIGMVAVDEATLPTKTDGAVARAAIDCGRSYAIWLLVRDACNEVSTWLRLTW